MRERTSMSVHWWLERKIMFSLFKTTIDSQTIEKKYKIKVMALSETGIYDSGVKMIGDYTLIYSGLPRVNKTRIVHGVAVCLNTEASGAWKNSGAEWEAVNERIIKIRMNCKPINVTIIVVCAPVNPSTTAASQSNDKFYSDLQDTLDKV